MARPLIISLELPTQGFSFQDVESSIIMFPFRSMGRKREKGRGTVRERESDRVKIPDTNGARVRLCSHATLSHVLHHLPTAHKTKNNKKQKI